ncbi:MAG: hypothetical protein NWF04_05685 [Candidatus Bathyarchaeota archaeon]|nr:hypothetical protein [Candidatus Bathyarchaeota archaeon]
MDEVFVLGILWLSKHSLLGSWVCWFIARTETMVDVEAHLKQRLPLITCECGFEILLVPDLMGMNRAVEAHVAEHEREEGTVTAERIRRLLIDEVLKKAGEVGFKLFT